MKHDLTTKLTEQGPARAAAYIAQEKASHDQALFVQQAYAAAGPLRNAQRRSCLWWSNISRC